MKRLFRMLFLAAAGFGFTSTTSASGADSPASEQPTILMQQQND